MDRLMDSIDNVKEKITDAEYEILICYTGEGITPPGRNMNAHNRYAGWSLLG